MLRSPGYQIFDVIHTQHLAIQLNWIAFILVGSN